MTETCFCFLCNQQKTERIKQIQYMFLEKSFLKYGLNMIGLYSFSRIINLLSSYTKPSTQKSSQTFFRKKLASLFNPINQRTQIYLYANTCGSALTLPIDLDIARTPKTRCPFQGMTLPPDASILAYSSSLFG